MTKKSYRKFSDVFDQLTLKNEVKKTCYSSVDFLFAFDRFSNMNDSSSIIFFAEFVRVLVFVSEKIIILADDNFHLQRTSISVFTEEILLSALIKLNIIYRVMLVIIINT
jgi:hypothetical protein